jgi:tetratricopeptide (TPR) repeat protein
MNFLARLQAWQLGMIAAAVALTVFGPHLGNAFVTLDDGLLIYKNVAIQELSARSLWHIVSSYDPELYVPLTLFSYQLNHFFFGLNPTSYHVVNLLLHVGSTLLVCLLMERLTDRKLLAFFIALLFAIHPIQTEAVLWAAARKDVLSSFFFFLSCYLYVRARQEDHALSYWIAVLAFALGLLSKVSIIVLPAILLLIEWRQGSLRLRTLWKTLLPFVLLSILFGLIALGGKSENISSLTPLDTVLLSFQAAMFYLWKILWPVHLSVIYPQTEAISLTTPSFILSIVGVLALLVAAWFSRRKFQDVTFGILFYLLLLLPTFSTFWKNGFIFLASDRYAYIACIGIFFALSSFVLSLVTARVSMASFRVVGGVAAVLILLFVGRSYVQGYTWKDSEALYHNVLSQYPDSAMSYNNLGDAYQKDKRYEEAEAAFLKAAELDPKLMSARYNLGEMYRSRGDFDQAKEEMQKAVEIVDGKQSLNLDELGPYYAMAQLYDQLNDQETAISWYQRAIDKGPQFGEPHYNLGLQYQKHGRSAEAIREFEKCIELEPKYGAAHYHLASLYAEDGKLQDAVKELELTLKYDPSNAKAAEHLKNIRAMMK